MNYLIWFVLLDTTFIWKVLSDTIDPFDLRDYDPKTKTMRTSDVANSMVDTHRCSVCIRYIQNYCDPSVSRPQNEVIVKNYQKPKDSPDAVMLQTFLVRFVSLLLQKSGLKESDESPDIQEASLLIKLSRQQLRVLNDFRKTKNPALLQDIDEILSKQLHTSFPPISTENYFQKIYEAKEFFSQSFLVILGIVFTAALFFYNVFVKNQIRMGILSLVATVFFTGYFWTYWKMYGELMADYIRITEQANIDCYPTTQYFLGFISYTVPPNIENCKEYYYSKHVSPLSKLTPTLVFYETVKIFWSGFLHEVVKITLTLFKQLIEHSPWYIRWTVLPLVLIFICVSLMICIAFLTGKKFKLSHPLFGTIELATDLRHREQANISKLKNSNGSGFNLNCLTCGTEFIQSAAAQNIVATRHFAEKGDNTDSASRAVLVANDSERTRCIASGRMNYVTNVVQTIVSPFQLIKRLIHPTSYSQRTTDCTDSGPTLRKEFLDVDEESEDSDNVVTLEDCLEDDAGEGKINKAVSSTKYTHQIEPSITESSLLKSSYSVKEPLACTTKFRAQSSPVLVFTDTATNLQSKKKYFEEVKYTRSPDPGENRLVPVIFSECATSSSASSKLIETDSIENLSQEFLARSREKYFTESNEKIKKHFSFKLASAKLLRRNKSRAVELEVQNERRFQSRVKRKLSL